MFIDNLLALNHSLIFSLNSVFTVEKRVSMSLLEDNKFVLSTYILGSRTEEAFGRSFT